MSRNFGKILIAFLVALILFLGHKARVFRYDFAPQPLIVLDEYSFAWQGLSLLTTGIPVSWSGFEVYENPYPLTKVKKWFKTNIQIDGKEVNFRNFKNYSKPETFISGMDLPDGIRQIHFVQPYLDHPPLTGLIIGGYEYLRGARFFSDVSAKVMRRPALYAGILTTFLIFLFGTFVYDKKVGLLSALIYSTVPTFVISSRMALAENFLNPTALLFLIFLFLFFKKEKKIFFYLASILAGLAILLKISGVFLLLTGIFLFVFKKRPLKEILIFSTITILIGSFYLIYGFYYDQHTFVKVLFSQGHKTFLGPFTFLYALVYPRITTAFLDGWVIWGFISLLIILFTSHLKKNFWLFAPIFSYLLLFIFLGSNDFGWYRYPFFPWLSLCLALNILEIYQKPSFGKILFFMLIPFASSLRWGTGIQIWQPYLLVFRIVVFISIILLLLEAIGKFKEKKFSRALSFVFLIVVAVAIILNIQSIRLVTINWYLLKDMPLFEF